MESNSSLSVRREGHGTPIVIVHGWMLSGAAEAYDFEPIFSTIEGFERHYIDLPGMGLTTANGVSDLDSILDHLDEYVSRSILPKPFLLVGSSCGGHLARAVAFKYADSVLGLLLRVPVIQPHSPNRDVGKVEPLVSNPAVLDELPSDLREEMGHIPIQSQEYIDALKEKFDNAYKPAVATADEKVLDAIRGDPAKYVLSKPMHSPSKPFNGPTLIVLGRHDTDVGYRDASSREVLDAYPRATSIVLDGATHALPVTKGEKLLFKALVLDWLSRVDEAH